MTVSTLGVLTVRKYSSLVPATRPLKASNLPFFLLLGICSWCSFCLEYSFFSVLDCDMNLARPSTLGKISTTALHFSAPRHWPYLLFLFVWLLDWQLYPSLHHFLHQEILLVLLSIMFMSSAVSDGQGTLSDLQGLLTGGKNTPSVFLWEKAGCQQAECQVNRLKSPSSPRIDGRRQGTIRS